MIKRQTVDIVSVKEIALDTFEFVLKSAYISEHAVAGQFLHIKIDGYTLRRPLSIASVNKTEATVTILFKIFGDGTDHLATYRKGMTLDVLGPCGNGFDLERAQKDKTALLIGGGIGVPPVYFLANQLTELGVNVISVIGFQEKEHVFYEEKFQELGETIVVTNDGSYGEKGFVTDVLDKVDEFNTYYSCGPQPMLKAVAAELKDSDGYISFEERMGCGVGVCYACVLPTKDESGYKKICSDGPVFSASEVIL